MNLEQRNAEIVQARSMRDDWIAAERAVMTGQSYAIGGNQITRADLSKIRESIEYWDKKLKSLDGTRKKRRFGAIIPRDL